MGTIPIFLTNKLNEMKNLIFNNLSLILNILTSISVIIICIRDYKSAEKEQKSKVFPVVICVVAIIFIFGNYIYQVNNSKEINFTNEKLQLKLSNIELQNKDLKNQLLDSLITINSLTKKLDESIENINNLNKQKKIDLLKNMKNEIEHNIYYLKNSLLNNKQIFIDNKSTTVTFYRFSIASIEKNISDGTITDKKLQKQLYSIHNLFIMSNKRLESITGQSYDVRAENMRIFFTNFDDEEILFIEKFCEGLEEYIKQIDK